MSAKCGTNSFFNFRLLLFNKQENILLSVLDERGAINFQQEQKFPYPFLIFIPQTSSDRYMTRDMSFTTKTDSWRYYDGEFSKLRQCATLPWQEPLHELLMRANLQPFKFRSSNQLFLAKTKQQI